MQPWTKPLTLTCLLSASLLTFGCATDGDSAGPSAPGPGGKGDDNASSTGVIARHEGIDAAEAEATPAVLDFERYTGTPYMQLYLEFPNDDVHDETELFTFDLDQYTALFRSRERFAYDSLEAWTDNSPPSGFFDAYEATTTGNIRKVSIERSYMADDGDSTIASRSLVELEVSAAMIKSVRLRVWKRGAIFGIPTGEQLVKEREIVALEATTPGLALYGDNRGWPLGRATTMAEVESSFEDDSEANFRALGKQ